MRPSGDSLLLFGRRRVAGFEWPFQHPANSSRAEMQSGSSQSLSNFNFAHAGTKCLHSPDDVGHVIGKAVDGDFAVEPMPAGHFHQGVFSHEEIVAAVIWNVEAVCLSDQPRAAFNSRIAMRSVGG